MEETIGYEALLSAVEWESLKVAEWDPEPPRKTSLPEEDALRLAKALDDYELVRVTDIGGSNCYGFWVRFRDERFELEYDICSHADYWDFISYFAAGQMWPMKALPKKHTVSVKVVDDGYELTCDACDFYDVASVIDADNLKRLHEVFVATLVDRSEVA